MRQLSCCSWHAHSWQLMVTRHMHVVLYHVYMLCNMLPSSAAWKIMRQVYRELLRLIFHAFWSPAGPSKEGTATSGQARAHQSCRPQAGPAQFPKYALISVSDPCLALTELWCLLLRPELFGAILSDRLPPPPPSCPLSVPFSPLFGTLVSFAHACRALLVLLKLLHISTPLLCQGHDA